VALAAGLMSALVATGLVCLNERQGVALAAGCLFHFRRWVGCGVVVDALPGESFSRCRVSFKTLRGMWLCFFISFLTFVPHAAGATGWLARFPGLPGRLAGGWASLAATRGPMIFTGHFRAAGGLDESAAIV